MNQPVTFQVNGTFIGPALLGYNDYGIHYSIDFRRGPRTRSGNVVDADVARFDALEAIRLLKARYCRFLDTRDIESWRMLFAPDVVVLLDLAVSTAGADPQTMAPLEGLEAFEPVVLGGIAGAATVHHCHTPEIELTSSTTATGIWAMEDMLFYPDGSALHGAGHYHENYEKRDGRWQITRLHLTRTLMRFTAASEVRS
jgi:hypothetical protein